MWCTLEENEALFIYNTCSTSAEVLPLYNIYIAVPPECQPGQKTPALGKMTNSAPKHAT